MAKSIQKTEIEESKKKISGRLETIAKLQNEVPSLKRAEEELDWMLSAEEKAPILLNLNQSENLLHILTELNTYLDQNTIYPSSPDLTPFVSSTGTSSSSDYIQHVYKIREAFPKNNEIQKWAEDVTQSYSALRIKQTRTEMVLKRLERLDVKLMKLHQRAIDACLSASAGVQSPIEGAAFVRELLDSFKGELIRRCKEGKKATYQRVADNLAFDALKSAIIDQQEIYNDLHNELSGIIKSRATIEQSRIEELLSLTEDHILVVTIGLNPEKIGFEFYS